MSDEQGTPVAYWRNRPFSLYDSYARLAAYTTKGRSRELRGQPDRVLSGNSPQDWVRNVPCPPVQETGPDATVSQRTSSKRKESTSRDT